MHYSSKEFDEECSVKVYLQFKTLYNSIRETRLKGRDIKIDMIKIKQTKITEGL